MYKHAVVHAETVAFVAEYMAKRYPSPFAWTYFLNAAFMVGRPGLWPIR